MKRKARMRRWLCPPLITFIGTISACSESTKPEPEPPPEKSGIFSSLLAASVIPGETVTIAVTAIAENGKPDTFSCRSDNGTVAAVQQIGPLVAVTGVGLGTATLMITSGSGAKKEIPIRVYDHLVLDTGDLQIIIVDMFDMIVGFPMKIRSPFFHPTRREGYHALGSLAFREGYNGQEADKKMTMMMVKQPEGSTALRAPVDYTLLWTHSYTDGPMTNHICLWEPVPPPGYKALGVVACSGTSKPPVDFVVCVREDLTSIGRVADSPSEWHKGDATGTYMSCWNIEPPKEDQFDESKYYLPTGTIAYSWSWDSPPTNPDKMRLLNVALPLLSGAPLQAYTPRLDGYETPPEETVPIMSREVLIPFTIVADRLANGESLEWRVRNSPFYRLERQIFYKRQYHSYNETSQVQDNSVTITSGVSDELTTRIWTELNLSFTYSAGIRLGPANAGWSATVSKTFGYETQSKVAQFVERRVTSTVSTAPGTAAALWQQYNRFVLKRYSGVATEVVSDWEFGIDSYHVDQYPD